MRSLFRFPVRLLVAAVAVGVAWCSPGSLAADRTITVLGPGAEPGEVAIDASPPFADPVFAAWRRPSTIDNRLVVTVVTLREPGAEATVYQVVPGSSSPLQVVVSGDRVLDQLEYPRDRTAVDLGVDALGRDVYQITVSAPLTAPPGDFNQDGARSVQDIFDFLAVWQAGSRRADDGSGSCEPQDIFEFIGQYFGAG